MDLPEDILEKLKCESCEDYLSRGPVYLKFDVTALCSKCYTSKSQAIRNKEYEAIAKFFQFPCKNRDLGCPAMVPFGEDAEEIGHEVTCEYRQYVCPVLGSASCEWLGTRQEILQHCQTKHSDKVLDNPTTFTHDISKSSVQTFLLRAFKVLFLLHAKVCVASGKIFHSVRFLGGTDETTNYHFTLDVKRGDELITKAGQVAPQGCLAIQEDTSLALDTNSLLGILGGFDATTFTVILKHRVIEVVTCVDCDDKVEVLSYRDESGWKCEDCAPDRRECKFRMCTHKDIAKKCKKHEWYFCERSNWCGICRKNIPRGTLIEHYETEHGDITHITGCTWRAIKTNCLGKFRLMSSVAGTLMCWYWMNTSWFELCLYTSHTSERLRDFRCSVKLTDPSTGRSRTYKLDLEYDWSCDWRIEIEAREFPSWSNRLDVYIIIDKKE